MHLYRAPGGNVFAFEADVLASDGRTGMMEAVEKEHTALMKPRLFIFKRNPKTGGVTLLLLDQTHPGPWVDLDHPPEIRMGRKEPV